MYFIVFESDLVCNKGTRFLASAGKKNQLD